MRSDIENADASALPPGQFTLTQPTSTSEQQSAANANANANATKPTRHRASIACASCRDRRIRCVVPPGERDCTQCKRSNTECIIKNDDERRRQVCLPVSKAYMSALTNRVAMLESMLVETGKELPPANYPPKIRPEAPPAPAAPVPQDSDVYEQQHDPDPAAQSTTPRSTQDSSSDGDNNYQNDGSMLLTETHPPPNTQSRAQNSNKRELLVRMLLSTRGHLSFDQLSGRLRFFGPASNFHIYADSTTPRDSGESLEQTRRTERIIRSLTIETHDYLMDLFWEYYNSVLYIVHKEAFYEDMQDSKNKHYSGFLHINILAMGYRFADMEREDMKKITLGNRECTLHREARYMLDLELERPGGLPSVQAFLLLGDLECGVGRDNTGWMYAGMANRLCFDLGLHLDCQNDGLDEKEMQIRHMTLFACVIYDKYWALFLGRPTGIKTSDLEMYRMSKKFASLSTCTPAGEQRSLETQIYEELLDLMELAGKITEIRGPEVPGSRDRDRDPDNANRYMYVLNLDRQLQTWYRRLPASLVWKPENIATAPFSFFLLHQQYHCSLILLHRPWAKYDDDDDGDGGGDGGHEDDDDRIADHHAFMSRAICTRQAIRVARIFWHHRQRFDTRRIFVTGIQHAGTAATALVAALAFIKSTSDRKNNLPYLECLAAALHDMSATYQPAASMSAILQAVMLELQNASSRPSPPALQHQHHGVSATTAIPARRESNAIDDADSRICKKRQLSKSSTRPDNPNANAAGGPGALLAFTPQSMVSTSTSSKPFTMLQGMPPPVVGEGERNGYVMVTPRSECAVWPSLNSDFNVLDHPMSFTWMSGQNLSDMVDAPLVGQGMYDPFETETGERRNAELDFFSL
ncbi:hypothetical protein DL98DRAFT_474418 [Cadophora sp. DSE1049]|nr:hypothetical protein DL98DRAFT_474418 [Cadophora sp. DSE1049]